MTTPTLKLYPPASLDNQSQSTSNIDLEQRLEKKKTNYLNSSNISMNYIKEKITYFKDKNHKSKGK